MFVTKRLSPYLALLAITVSIACGNEGTSPDQTQAVTSSTRLYEGARLIAGDGREAIEESALLVDEGRIVAIGNRGDLGLPLGAVRIDLTGKTIMPMLVSLHGHVGYQDELSYAEANYTRANIIDHLDKYAYYGVGTILSLGTDAGGLALEIRGEQERDLLPGARLLTAGRGLAAPNAGPFSQALRGSAYGVSTKAEARQAVRELAASDVNVVKIWVDDRNGTVEKLRPELYATIIEEAHSRDLLVIAHVYYASDAMSLVEAGIDGFAHLVRDEEMSNALVAQIRNRGIFVMPNLGISERGTHETPPDWLDDPLLLETVSLDLATRSKESFGERRRDNVVMSRNTYEVMEKSLLKLHEAGATIVLGADSGVQDHFFGYSELRELELMVAAGLTPSDVIVAATSRPAEVLGLDNVGSLTAGKYADFIVLNDNPLENIANVYLIDAVYMRGQVLPRESLSTEFSEQPEP